MIYYTFIATSKCVKGVGGLDQKSTLLAPTPYNRIQIYKRCGGFKNDYFTCSYTVGTRTRTIVTSLPLKIKTTSVGHMAETHALLCHYYYYYTYTFVCAYFSEFIVARVTVCV